MSTLPFWREKTLEQMTDREWESLCDGCGKCCLIKLEDEATGSLFYTDVACHLLDLKTCRCTRYKDRQKLVPDCVAVRPDNIASLAFMPSTCAYRLLAEGKELFWWHPLVSGRRDTVVQAGASAHHRVISEEELDESDLPDHIVDWPR
ncbi:MAG TPA: YcgN family cysteine cluster protein [Stellaceae bacterium]|nr:YcgN family cysteine cluster protein [Stellaceae bacterium]